MRTRGANYGIGTILTAVVIGVVWLTVGRSHRHPTHYERAYERAHAQETHANLERMQSDREKRQAQEAVQAAQYQAYLKQTTALIAQVEAKWRADVDAAGVSGALGAVPPMLAVEEHIFFLLLRLRLAELPLPLLHFRR